MEWAYLKIAKVEVVSSNLIARSIFFPTCESPVAAAPTSIGLLGVGGVER